MGLFEQTQAQCMGMQIWVGRYTRCERSYQCIGTALCLAGGIEARNPRWPRGRVCSDAGMGLATGSVRHEGVGEWDLCGRRCLCGRDADHSGRDPTQLVRVDHLGFDSANCGINKA